MSDAIQFLPSAGRHLYVGGITGQETDQGRSAGVLGAQLGFGIDVLALDLSGGDSFGTKITFAPEVSVHAVGRRLDEGGFDGITGTLRYGGAIGISGGGDAMRLEAIGGAESREGHAGYVGGRLSLGNMPVLGTTGGLFVQGDATLGGDRSGDWHVGVGYVARF